MYVVRLSYSSHCSTYVHLKSVQPAAYKLCFIVLGYFLRDCDRTRKYTLCPNFDKNDGAHCVQLHFVTRFAPPLSFEQCKLVMNFHTLIIHVQVTGHYYFYIFLNLENGPPVEKSDLKDRDFRDVLYNDLG